jgi:hypothetical protein
VVVSQQIRAAREEAVEVVGWRWKKGGDRVERETERQRKGSRQGRARQEQGKAKWARPWLRLGGGRQGARLGKKGTGDRRPEKGGRDGLGCESGFPHWAGSGKATGRLLFCLAAGCVGRSAKPAARPMAPWPTLPLQHTASAGVIAFA